MSGIDVVGLATPLIDTAFELAGNAKVTVTFTFGPKERYNPRADTSTADPAAYQLTIDVLRSKWRQDALNAETVNDRHLSVNMTDIEREAAKLGKATPKIDTAHTATFDGRDWQIIEADPITTNRIYRVRVR